jgi:NitT/TauT family transport system substrate-binding protein
MFGTSYTSLQAMLESAGLTEVDIKLEQIGFTQVESVLSGRVDVAMGFVNNEPIILKNQGREVKVILAADANKSAGNGVITTDKVLENTELVKHFLKASQEAVALTIQEPSTAFEASKTYVENLGTDRMEVLVTSIQLYQSEYSSEFGLGYTDPAGWQSTLDLLKRTARVDTDLPATAFFSNDYLTPGVGVN